MIRSLILCFLLAGVNCVVPPRASMVPTTHSSDTVRSKEVHWFEQFDDSLSLLQSTINHSPKNPPTLEWIGAFINTLTASSVLTYSKATTCGLIADPQQGRSDHYQHVVTDYFNRENTGQIYDAAYDDIQWVVLEWLEAIRALDDTPGLQKSMIQTSFFERAATFYDRIDHEFDTSLCSGGLTWDPDLKPYKNAITNQLFVASSIAMYLQMPGQATQSQVIDVSDGESFNATTMPITVARHRDEQFLKNALKAYEWIQLSSLLNDQHLFIDGFHIPAGSSACTLRDNTIYTYNQGVILSGYRGLWEATSNAAYLLDGYRLIETTVLATGWTPSGAVNKWSGLGSDGVLADACDRHMNCSQDAQAFKGIYFHHLSKFCAPLVAPFVDDQVFSAHKQYCTNLLPWIEHNAEQAVLARDETGLFGGWWGDVSVKSMPEGGVAKHMPKRDSDRSIPKQANDDTSKPTVEATARVHARQLLIPDIVCEDDLCQHYHVKEDTHKREVHQQRTIETHASGVAVVKAALDFNLWYM